MLLATALVATTFPLGAAITHNLDALLALGLGKVDAIFLAAIFSMGCYMPLVKILHRASPWRG